MKKAIYSKPVCVIRKKNSSKTFGQIAVFLFVAGLYFAKANVSLADVSYNVSSESTSGTSGVANVISFSWPNAATGTPEGILVFINSTTSATDYISSVTYGGVTMTRIAGGSAVDNTAGEPGRTDTFFLGSSVPTGTQNVVVNRTSNSQRMYGTAIAVNANFNTEVTGLQLVNNDGTFPTLQINDGSPGTNSLRFAAGYSGGNNILSPGTGSTAVLDIDYGSYTFTTVRETTAGQGSRGVGFNYNTSDDRAGVYLAVREVIPAPFTITGTIYTENETSPYACLTNGSLSIHLAVNNVSGTYSGDCTADTGAWSTSVPAFALGSGSTVVAYISGGSVHGSTVLISSGTDVNDVPIIENGVVLRDDVNDSITNTEIGSGDTSDSDDLFTITSGSYATNDSTYETHIYTADTYAPAGGVITGKLHVVGNFTGNASLILSGTGSGTLRPLYIDSGTFTAPTTTTYTGNGSFDIEGTTYTNLTINNSNAVGTLIGAASISGGNLTITSGIFDLSTYTANRTGAGGTLTLSSGATLKIGGTGTLPANFSTHSVDAASTVEYYGTTQTVGTINAGSYGNLTISGTGAKTLAGTEGVLGDLTISGGSFVDGGYQVTGNASGILSTSAGTTLVLGNTTSTSFPTGFISGNISLNSTSTVIYASNSAQNVSGTPTYGNMITSGTGTKTLLASASVAGSLTVSTGIFDLSTYTANRTGAGGTLTVSNGATLKIGGTNPLPTNYQTLSFGATSTEEYSGTTQTVTSATYGNLSISGSSSKTLGGAVDAVGILTVSSSNTLSTGSPSNYALTVSTANINGGTLNINGSTFTINGTSGTLLTNTGTLTTGSGSIAKFTGAAAPTALLSGSFTGSNTFYNLILSPSISGDISYPMGAAFDVANLSATPQASSTFTLTVNLEGNASVTGTTSLTGTGSGKSDLNTGAYNLSSGAMTIGSPGTLTAGSSPALNVGGDLTITGKLTAPSGTATTSFTLGGDFLLTGSFVNSSGMLTLTGTDPSQFDYNANATFYKLYVSSSSAGKDIYFDETYQTIIDKDITITGTDCSGGRIYLDSLVNDNPWDINIKTGGTPNITYIDLEDANGSLSEVTPAATDSTETGTNTGWSVTAGACGGGGITLSGIIYNTSETSPYACNSTNLTVYLRVNNSGTYSAECTTSSGSWSVSGVSVSSGSTIVAYISEVGTKGSTVLVSNGSAVSDIPIIENRVVLRDDANGSITNTEMGSGDTSDSNDLFTITSGSYSTNDSAYETHIMSTETYAPGGGVTTGRLHIDGIFIGSNSLILSGTGSGISRPLYVNGGTFTAPTTTTYTGAGAFDVEGTTYTSLTINSSNAIGTLIGAASISGGNLTITSGIFDLSTYTANRTGAGGTLTLSSGATLKIGGTGTLPANFSTHSVDAASTVEYYGTTQTVGTINAGSYGNLTISGTGAKTLAGTEGVLGDLTISGGSFVDGGYQITGNASGILSTSAGTTLVLGNTTSTSFPTGFISGNISLNSTSTVLYKSSLAQTVSTTPSYGNLEIKPAANSITDTLASGTLTVAGNLTLGNGTNTGDVVEATTYDPNISVTGNVVVNTGTSFTNSDSTSATLNIDGNLTISGTFTAPRGTNDNSFTLAGNFINSGSYVHNSGQITLDPSGSSVQLDYSSDTTFYQFSILSASAGKDIQFDEVYKTIIANDITITGTNCSGGRIYLDSMVNDNPWDINIKTGGTPNITYIDLEDANGSLSEVTPAATDSTETGTNTGWSVTAGVCTPGADALYKVNIRGINLRGINLNAK